MPFNFEYYPPFPPGSVLVEASADRVTSFDARNACFSVDNKAYFTQTVGVTVLTRVRTPPVVPPFNGINIWTDSNAWGQVSATALPGWARARVEARLRVLDSTGTTVLAESGPQFYGGSSIDIPVFYGAGFQFNGTAWTDAVITASVAVAPLIVELRISSWAVAAGWATAIADIHRACVTAIRVFSF